MPLEEEFKKNCIMKLFKLVEIRKKEKVKKLKK